MSINSCTRVSQASAYPRSDGGVTDIQRKLQLALSTINPALSDRVNIVAIENVNGKKICKIEVDLSKMESLNQAVVGDENPNNAEVAGIIIDILRLGSRLAIYEIDALEIVHLNLKKTKVSSRSVIGKFKWNFEGKEHEFSMPTLFQSLTQAQSQQNISQRFNFTSPSSFTCSKRALSRWLYRSRRLFRNRKDRIL